MASNEANKPSNQHINQSESKNPPDSLPAIRSDIYSGTEGSFLKCPCQLLSVSDLIKKLQRIVHYVLRTYDDHFAFVKIHVATLYAWIA